MGANAYRADIDGLRAVSILSVLLFHAHVPGFGGGFVGVDIFFVISGYLITNILNAPGGGSVGQRLKGFYLRRCRRILPALLVLLAVTTVLAMLLLSSRELSSFGRYLGFTTFLLSNIAAWTDRSVGWPPLVHLWTIAVEEQFYLAYPCCCWGSAGRERCHLYRCSACSPQHRSRCACGRPISRRPPTCTWLPRVAGNCSWEDCSRSISLQCAAGSVVSCFPR